MMVIQWVGIALTVVGLMFNGYKFTKENPEVVPKIQLLKHTEQPKFMYSQINIAYDVTNNKHWFQHSDGQWREFPPKPTQVQMQYGR